MFLKTLGEACIRTGWMVHAYVLMGNHYHLLLETQEANLVVGMQWVQSTFTQRFNARHHERGHLFQGRYKAIPVEPGIGYFPAVATYIHLNPVRMEGYDFQQTRLVDSRWSSYPAYVRKNLRPNWLCVNRVLEGLGMADTAAGRRKYTAYMMGRVAEVRHSDQPWKADQTWQEIRGGWHFGGEKFRLEILERVEGALQKGKRTSFSGDEVREHGEACAEEWITKGMGTLGLSEVDLANLKMNSPEKYALAWLARRNTTARPAWIKERLQMGTATGFATFLSKLECAKRGEWGYEVWRRVKGLAT